ncbi:hypothetical protein [Christiangramia sabulilitoris]|uniref:STAS domain-containing protein n=1 Tax=Christiangramia sabulilitoris TaxID=2583991 RepID=A0A550HX75_9FLAO|nr:hypothetical protein [Christiangramia sabulilitoris]TRO63339.1 hypothetical protein FGM01_13820 [Christiangramia sabulilitoris]
MALKIKENNGIFEISGRLSSSNSFQVRKYFEVILKMKHYVRISLEQLDGMDIGSVFEFRALIMYAARRGRVVNFVGDENRRIRGAFLGAGVDLMSYNTMKVTS